MRPLLQKIVTLSQLLSQTIRERSSFCLLQHLSHVYTSPTTIKESYLISLARSSQRWRSLHWSRSWSAWDQVLWELVVWQHMLWLFIPMTRDRVFMKIFWHLWSTIQSMRSPIKQKITIPNEDTTLRHTKVILLMRQYLFRFTQITIQENYHQSFSIIRSTDLLIRVVVLSYHMLW